MHAAVPLVELAVRSGWQFVDQVLEYPLHLGHRLPETTKPVAEFNGDGRGLGLECSPQGQRVGAAIASREFIGVPCLIQTVVQWAVIAAREAHPLSFQPADDTEWIVASV